MKTERLIYLPLGGSGEIGMNMYIYGYGAPGKERYIMVDIGVTFPKMDSSPGVELIMPDIGFVLKNINKFDAIIITHAHEDHIGALGYLVEKIDLPIFCLKFTSLIASKKIEQMGNNVKNLNVISKSKKEIKIGPFLINFIDVPHSIPEASALLIETPVGKIVHTGDLKLDKKPILGSAFKQKIFQDIGKKDILALVCDSTNIFNDHFGRSESSLNNNLSTLMQNTKGIFVATTFASNIARLLTIANVGKENGRSLLVLGRAMINMINNAKISGVLKNFPPILTVEEANEIPRKNLLILATGSQGENRAAAAQLSRDRYMGIELQKDDVFLFSSKTIPGNEIAVNKIINNFVLKDVTVVDEEDGKYHVSGHANKPDLILIHKLIKPKVLIPMHGEIRHLKAHTEIGKSNGINSIIVSNGDLIEIKKDGNIKLIDKVDFGKIYLDGNCLIEEEKNIIKKRVELATKGVATISILVNDADYNIEDVWVKTLGISEKDNDENDIVTSLENEIDYILNTMDIKFLKIDEEIEQNVRRVVNRYCKNNIGKKPVISIFVHRI